MFAQFKISRRTFCGIVLGTSASALALVAGSCQKPRVKVFKFPESEEEIADFNEFFTAADMTEEEIIRRLNITGTPKIANLQYGTTYKDYPKQNEIIREVQFDSDKDGLNGILLKYYESKVSVSMGRLSGLLGQPAPQGTYVGKRHEDSPTQTSIVANIPYGHTPGPTPKQTTFRYQPSSFWPKGSGFDSEVTVHTNYTDDNVRTIESVRFYRINRG